MRQKSQKAVEKKKKFTQSTQRNMVTIKYERDMVGGKRNVKTICSICFEDLKPFAQDLQAISICGHVFHEPCLQQWFKHCLRRRRYSCPVCMQKCSAKNVSRLYFQSVEKSNDSVLAKNEEDSQDLRCQIQRLEDKDDGLSSLFRFQGKDLKTGIDNQTNQEQSEDVWSSPNWSPHLEKIFVELLIEEMNYHPDVCVSDFNEEAWDHVCKEFNQQTGLNNDKMELKKHLAVLRKRYCIVKPLHNHGNFGWNYRWKMVDVDDLMWKEYVQVHPEIAPYRKWVCPIYEELCKIFTKPMVTGKQAIVIGGDRSGRNYLARSRENVNDIVLHRCNKRQSAQLLGSGPNKKYHKGTENSREINSVLKSNGTATPQTNDPYSESHCVAILNGMQGVDCSTYSVACDLFHHPTWRKTFISTKSEKRLTWLKAMLPSVP